MYKITKPGINCRHRAGYSERKFLPKCKLDEKCKLNRDCEKGKCHRGKCKIEFECTPDKLDNCNRRQCKKLNEDLYYDKYKYSSGKCRYNSCNKEQYHNCGEDDCIGLGYRFKWDEGDKECVNRDYDVKICSQFTCPDGYSLQENNKDYKCERKLSRDELQEKLGDSDIEFNEEDEGFISECNIDNCCKKIAIDPSPPPPAPSPAPAPEYCNNIVNKIECGNTGDQCKWCDNVGLCKYYEDQCHDECEQIGNVIATCNRSEKCHFCNCPSDHPSGNLESGCIQGGGRCVNKGEDNIDIKKNCAVSRTPRVAFCGVWGDCEKEYTEVPLPSGTEHKFCKLTRNTGFPWVDTCSADGVQCTQYEDNKCYYTLPDNIPDNIKK